MQQDWGGSPKCGVYCEVVPESFTKAEGQLVVRRRLMMAQLLESTAVALSAGADSV